MITIEKNETIIDGVIFKIADFIVHDLKEMLLEEFKERGIPESELEDSLYETLEEISEDELVRDNIEICY